jgi:plasmid stabilization system protein ParE
MSGYVFHPLAESELLDAVRYYEERRKGVGRSFLVEIRRCIQLVLRNPQIGTMLGDDVRRKPLRRFPYSLLYAQDSSTITILAVMHQKRRPDYWRDRL